ncbi:MAG: rod shape-determining protein [Candidatus Taylorbacteria bacterium RIFCSPHIGHO2_02_49_25]|uniref:Cell shape-determining protein MreB n=1 Tax=Candidatus Taylorbacteria bacterium RIFCSPHIGHO2_02_49_25 TaxID=1802305 RepID=A0A1G2MEQ4_9BACT|nr:MAG: Actin-like protein ATPase involved in cell morphogenesis [Parcubacteria group bacterium GW2011_GWF2_50_9]OHA21723.1 MAG: rod shape-determining protein [Candidatus Taylorbacteria bacterium RIFCSPHIGHO2_01_FULL_49_60]OHA22376.1 MAG: rod shape-determining protein [Candidatus Taylorbacteria bacterium RIFCSPHIGHO2_02_49_25]OHA35856.1 MAG: rod shape-determining protein [Candidatus Taylorbacteria bacterium RIFCSPLOWO2_02_50_13]OHA37176.1 MAG: rod shape-determining protein [Candidatus Taylorbac
MFKEHLKKHWDRMNGYLSNDIGIDLGTANTLVYMRGQGIIINEPSVVAVNQKTGQVVAVGAQAREMLGRTPAHIVAVKPLVGGVISDFEVTEEMLAYLIRRAEANSRKLLGPRVVVGVPSGITNVETRAVRDATRNNGASRVFIVEEPMAAAIGIRLPVNDPVGNMIVDIGGGTSDIAVISLGGIVRSKSMKVAGDKFNQDIISFIRGEHKLLIGEKTAENLKIAIGSVLPLPAPLEAAIRGRDLVTGLPREIVVTDADVREAITSSVDILIEAVREVLETTPPEIVSDVIGRGLYLVGGGGLLRGLGELLAENINIPVHCADDPMTAVARGAGIILEDFERYKDVLIESRDELPLHA